MFDDLVTKKKIIKKFINDTSSYNNSPPRCFRCCSRFIKFNGGHFINSNSFRQKMLCKDCNFEWFAILNNSLKADWLEIEIKEGD